jgi:predicted enzyme related to lactoylglutathione lyase
LRLGCASATVRCIAENQEVPVPEMTKYAHGVPSWVDADVHDLEAALGFYTQLFGWESQELGEEPGQYRITSKGGRSVAALSVDAESMHPHWTLYVNVDDVDETARRVTAAGGRVLFGPQDVMTAGRMLTFADPTGAFMAAWQPRDHPGAQLVGEPGCYGWSELSTSDVDRAKAFYTAVFGWDWGGSEGYAEAQVSGQSVAGVMHRPEAMPADVPDNWLVYFGAGDLDVDTRRATDLGASVLVPPTPIRGGGRFAVLRDPEGAAFGLYEGH